MARREGLRKERADFKAYWQYYLFFRVFLRNIFFSSYSVGQKKHGEGSPSPPMELSV